MQARKIVVLFLLATGMALMVYGCEEGDSAGTGVGDDESGQGTGDTDTDIDLDNDTDVDSDSDLDVDNDADGDGDGGGDICAEEDFDIEFKRARVMVLLDNSGSMTESAGGSTKEEQAVIAIKTLVTDPVNQDKEFGLDIFPDGTGMDPTCGTNGPPPVPIAVNNQQNIVDYLDNHYDPDGATPLVNALKYYTNQANATSSGLYEENTNGYIIVVSDGGETCAMFQIVSQIRTAVQQLVDQYNIKLFAIGFGSGVSAQELNAIAQNGGTTITTYLQADNLTQLQSAFAQIAEEAVSCRFEITPQDEDEVDLDEVNFYFDGEVVPMDPNNQNGWNWVDDEKTTMEFYGDFCEQLKNGEVEKVSATFGCPTVVVN